MTFTLSLISTETTNVKLITKTEQDAQKLIQQTDALSVFGDFESLDYQFSITEREFNNFDRFSGASYEPVSDGDWQTLNGIDFILSGKEKDAHDVNDVVVVTKKEDSILDIDNDLFDDDNFDLSDFQGNNVGYNSDDCW